MKTLPAARAYAEPVVTAGFTDSASFEFAQRAARALAQSTLVPEQFRALTKEKKSGRMVENPNAIPNCIIALNMAMRMGADPLMVMQNLYVVEGRPSWSAQFVIAAINACGRYSPLRFDLSTPGAERTVTYETTRWVDGSRVSGKTSCTVRDRTCKAWAIEKESGERLDGPEISMAMAEAEGWLGKNGSKWQTMPEMMLRYRAASFFGRLYAPELLMGLATQDEAAESIDLERSEDGIYQVEQPGQKSPPEEGDAIGKPSPSPRACVAPRASGGKGKQKDQPAAPPHDPETGEIFDQMPAELLLYDSGGDIAGVSYSPEDWLKQARDFMATLYADDLDGFAEMNGKTAAVLQEIGRQDIADALISDISIAKKKKSAGEAARSHGLYFEE